MKRIMHLSDFEPLQVMFQPKHCFPLLIVVNFKFAVCGKRAGAKSNFDVIGTISHCTLLFESLMLLTELLLDGSKQDGAVLDFAARTSHSSTINYS
jgi:hypothetical protein